MHRAGWAGGLWLRGCPLLSPCLCLGCAAAPTQSLPLQCVLTGHWINDLGSTMNISKVQENGSFSGTYLTVPSMSPKKIPKSPLLGFQQHTDQPTFGFTVKWNSTSTSLFQCFVDDNGNDVLETMWLLRLDADSEKNNWKATLGVGALPPRGAQHPAELLPGWG
uniref:Avidin n=1 Tax=Bubo bubo TaxID=30461 RepID=A0A8C0E8V7_BUBBB